MKQVEKSTVRYRRAPAWAERRCENCAMFHPRLLTCDLVKGRIRAADTCVRWTRRESS
jgi:hypothetical protein